MAEDVIIVDLNKAALGKYRVDLKTGKWGEVQEALITTDNVKGPHFPSIPFGYFLKERPPAAISGESLGTLESLLVLLPQKGKALKRVYLNGAQVREDELSTIRFKPTDSFLDVIVMDESSFHHPSP